MVLVHFNTNILSCHKKSTLKRLRRTQTDLKSYKNVLQEFSLLLFFILSISHSFYLTLYIKRTTSVAVLVEHASKPPSQWGKKTTATTPVTPTNTPAREERNNEEEEFSLFEFLSE